MIIITVAMKVCHLTSVHPPFDVRIFHKQCRTLAQCGYEVVLIVPHHRCEVRNHVRILGVPKSVMRRQRITSTTRQVYALALQERADIYHFHDPELIPVGLLLRVQGKHVIYDVHEDVPRQTLSKDWIPRVLRRPISAFVEWMENIAAQAFSAIVAATPTIARRFPAHKTVCVQNFPMPEELTLPHALPYADRAPNVIYIGGIAKVRGAIEMALAMNHFVNRPQVRLLMAGPVSPAGLEKEVLSANTKNNVSLLGVLSRAEVAELLAIARVGLVVLQPAPNYLDSYPVKLFEYMSAGIPAVVSDFPLWREIVSDSGCGLLVNPSKPTEIATAVQWLLDHPHEAEQMGQRGREAVRLQYNWQSESAKLIGLYERITRQASCERERHGRTQETGS